VTDLLGAAALRLADLGPWAPLLYVLLYAVATVALVPGTVLTLAAGALFGFWQGALVVFSGATAGSALAFGVARTLGARHVSRWLSRDARFGVVTGVVADGRAAIVMLLRLSPIVPFNLLNYALPLAGVRFRDFLLGSVGMVPGVALYTYSGVVIGDAARVLAGASAPRGPAYYALLAAGLLATGVAVVVIARAARVRLGTRRGTAGGGGGDQASARR